jgi:hypothetical protein
VVAREQVHVLRKPPEFQGMPGFRGEAGRCHPHPRRGRTEAKAGQARAQRVPLVAFGFRDGEHDHQPAVCLGGAGPLEDPDVAFGEHLQGGGGEAVARGAVPSLAIKDAAALQPGHRRPHRLPVRPEVRHQRDEGSYRQPVALRPPVEGESREDQLAKPGVIGDCHLMRVPY